MRTIYFDVNIPRVLATQTLGRVWKGAYLARSSPVHLSEFTPTLPGPHWVTVRNRLSGICASDLALVFVDVDPTTHAAALPGHQRIYLGHEVVGVVTEVGTQVETLKVGDRVMMRSRTMGGTCQSQELDAPCMHCTAGNYALCENQSARLGPAGAGGGWGDGFTAHQSELWRVPNTLTDEQALLLEPFACGVRAVLRRPPRPGERALVIGAGIIGLGVMQALRAIAPTARVYTVARHPQQRSAARRFGAQVVDGDLFAAAAAITDARLYEGPFNNRSMLGGFDLVYDCVNTNDTLNQALRITRASGAVVMVGLNLRRRKLDLSPILLQEIDLIGSLAHGVESWEGRSTTTFDLTARFINEGLIDTDGLVTHRFDLADWRQAVSTAADKRSGAIKVAFTFPI